MHASKQSSVLAIIFCFKMYTFSYSPCAPFLPVEYVNHSYKVFVHKTKTNHFSLLSKKQVFHVNMETIGCIDCNTNKSSKVLPVKQSSSSTLFKHQIISKYMFKGRFPLRKISVGSTGSEQNRNRVWAFGTNFLSQFEPI